MSIKDVIKKSVIESFSAETSAVEFWLVMLVTLLVGIYIFFLYRFVSRDGFYSRDFNKALVLLALVTAAIVYAMQSNLVISLGMVGALSIVRFRNAVKEPLDLVFLFWSISIGIIDGAGLYAVAVELSLVVTAALLLLNYVPSPKSALVLVVNSTDTDSMKRVIEKVEQHAKKSRVKSRNITAKGVDMIIEFRGAQEDILLEELAGLDGVKNVAILDHMGERRF